MADPTTWRPTVDMAEWMMARGRRSLEPGSLAVRTRVEMWMWRAALEEELRRMRWTLPELGLIADVCRGTVVGGGIAVGVGMVAGEVMDATSAEPGLYGGKWGVVERELCDKLRALGPAADHALADAVARWWEAGGEHSIEGWASVGLRAVRPAVDADSGGEA